MAELPGIDYRCVITYKDESTGLIYLRQMDVVLFQTEVRFFFSPQLLLLLLPQEKPADKNCYDPFRKFGIPLLKKE